MSFSFRSCSVLFGFVCQVLFRTYQARWSAHSSPAHLPSFAMDALTLSPINSMRPQNRTCTGYANLILIPPQYLTIEGASPLIL